MIVDFLNGEEIIIAKNGKPLLKFEKLEPDHKSKKPIGFFNCDIDMSLFDEPLDEMEKYI